MEQKNNLSPQNIVMGFQHMFVMFGATVLVPILTGLDISVALFASGIGTLFFHIVTKFKVPVYLGSSFSFIPPCGAKCDSWQELLVSISNFSETDQNPNDPDLIRVMKSLIYQYGPIYSVYWVSDFFKVWPS